MHEARLDLIISFLIGSIFNNKNINIDNGLFKLKMIYDRVTHYYLTTVNLVLRTVAWSFHTLKTGNESPSWRFWIHYLKTGSGRVFSGSRIWPKYGAGFRKIQNILAGNGIWLLPGKRASPKFRDVVFYSLSVENGKSWRLKYAFSRQMQFNKASVQLCLLSTEQNIYSDLVNDCLTEFSRSKQTSWADRRTTISTRCQESARGAIAVV